MKIAEYRDTATDAFRCANDVHSCVDDKERSLWRQRAERTLSAADGIDHGRFNPDDVERMTLARLQLRNAIATVPRQPPRPPEPREAATHLPHWACALRPLDRVQTMTVGDLAEQRREQRRRGRFDALPWWFVQRPLDDGRIEVCSATGYLEYIWPEDICDVRPAEPITVLAIPKSLFLERLSLEWGCLQAIARDDPRWYAPAHVLRVSKDRWGRLDRVYVSFLDASYNTETGKGLHYSAPLHDDSRRTLSQIARRTRLPVIPSTSTRSAAGGEVYTTNKEDAQANLMVRRVFASALNGHATGVATIADTELVPATTAKLNRMGVPFPLHGSMSA